MVFQTPFIVVVFIIEITSSHCRQVGSFIPIISRFLHDPDTQAITEMVDKRIDVAISGGGIAGLALAVALHQKHADRINFHIYESVSSHKDVGAGLALHKNAIAALSLLGPDLRKAYFDNASSMGEEDEEISTEVIIAHGEHMGELVAELGKAKGRKSITRADLLAGFLALFPSSNISYNKRLQSISETPGTNIVDLAFSDGSMTTCNLLLGADGVHSPTRAYVLPFNHPSLRAKNHDGWQIYRTLLPTSAALGRIQEKWTVQTPILLGPRGHVNVIPLQHRTRISAGVAVRGCEFLPDGSPKALNPEDYTDYSEDAQKIVRLVAEDPSMKWTAQDHDPCPSYASGNVGIMGDAAHASLPFAGNGAAQALEDACVLDALLAHMNSKDDAPALLKAFDVVRRPRAEAVGDLARRFGRIFACADPEVSGDIGKMKGFFKEAAAMTNEFDVGAQNLSAVEKLEQLLGEVDGAGEAAQDKNSLAMGHVDEELAAAYARDGVEVV